jgi:hypothetical protein
VAGGQKAPTARATHSPPITDAQAAAEAATAAAQTASGELMNKAGAMQASIDGIHHYDYKLRRIVRGL